MAEIQKTTNYNLLTPSENDFFDVDHQNTNMGIIDAELKNLNEGKEALVKNAAAKESLVDTDSLPLSDSADAQKTKKITFANMKTALKAYFDTLYNKYIHPEYTSRTSGLYKVTVDGTGHVSAAAAVAKSDITALGIPAQDTVTEIVDNLTSTDAAKALSAKQGKALNDLVSTKLSTSGGTMTGHLTIAPGQFIRNSSGDGCQIGGANWMANHGEPNVLGEFSSTAKSGDTRFMFAASYGACNVYTDGDFYANDGNGLVYSSANLTISTSAPGGPLAEGRQHQVY
jgi:hypothetical protein